MMRRTATLESIDGLRVRSSLVRDSAEQTVLALNDVSASAEQEESTGAVSALGLTLLQALVSDKGSLLIPDQTSDRDTLQRSVCNITIDLRGRDESW